MKTELLKVNEESVALGAKLIREGELVGFPTETVYGLGANALDARAVAKIFEAKGRPQDNPLIIHVPDALWLERYCKDVPESAHRLAERFWPGPLTMVMPRGPEVSDVTCAGLDTVGVRADGYHLLDMLMQSISLHDTLTLEPAQELTFSADGATRVPQDEGNLALRAALALRRHAGTAQGAMIHLHKRIPSGAGLGGGSADAAAVLHGLNALWELNLPMETLRQIGLTLGADVPFCLMGGLAHVRGIGEVIEPLPCPRIYHLVIIQPCRGLSTPQVFRALDGMDISASRPNTPQALSALTGGNLALLADSLGNTLQPVAISMRPQIRQAITTLREHGARAAQMTGSGSAVFGVFAAAARTAFAALSRRYPHCYLTQTL